MVGPTNSTRQNQLTARTRTKPNVSSEPAAKRRKLGPTNSQKTQDSSFADVLEQLSQDRAHDGVAAEGGADSWARPNLPSIDEKRNSIIFQQIDVDEATDYSNGSIVLRLFGVTEDGNSVLAYVTGFLPYFYVAVPRGFDESDIDAFADQLNKQAQGNFVRQIEIVKRRSLWGYRGDDWVLFMKLTISEPRNLPKIRDEFFFVSSCTNAFCMYLLFFDQYACLRGASAGFETFSPPDNLVQHSRVTLRTPCVS